MKYKICHVVFSTNRLEYLIPNLESQYLLNFENCEVHKIFIDDYPRGRNNMLIEGLVRTFGFSEVMLNHTNVGLSSVWTGLWNRIKERDYDYIFHQEDDIV
ncbi:hypothetical protein EBU95_09040, partial [bacterium]|nr:hypothetical protein [bacterium]